MSDDQNHEVFLDSVAAREENRTEWDFEFWRQLDRLSDLRYTARRRIVSDAVKMEDEYWRKRLDGYLLACVAQTGRANLLAGLRL
jgi:hypothetical protein